jgi:hypothetical protein
MKPDQAIAVLSQLINSPVAKLAFGINDLAACDLAVRTLADAIKPKPEKVVDLPQVPQPENP